ncbi:MAG: hypothetical protein P8Z81_16615, partial [Deinococcales bacterium]
MEGLLLAEALQPLEGRFPLARGAWRFPDEHTAVLPLASAVDGSRAVWIFSRPPSPRLALMPDVPPEAPAHTPFQEHQIGVPTRQLHHQRDPGLRHEAGLQTEVDLHNAVEGSLPSPLERARAAGGELLLEWRMRGCFRRNIRHQCEARRGRPAEDPHGSRSGDRTRQRQHRRVLVGKAPGAPGQWEPPLQGLQRFREEQTLH